MFHERSKHIKADFHIVRNRIQDATIKTFYVSSKNQLPDIFTTALGEDDFLRLLRRLGIINIFAHCIQYLEHTMQNQEERALLLRGSVENMKQRSQQGFIVGKCNEEASIDATTRKCSEQVNAEKQPWKVQIC